MHIVKERLLVRHAACDANDARIICGTSDPQLSERGIKKLYQQEKLKPNLEWKVLSSPLVRCTTTSRVLTSMEPELTDRLIEVDYGLLEGKSSEEMGTQLQFFGENWNHFTQASMSKYVDNARWLLESPHPKILAFTHGGYINFAVAVALKLNPQSFPFLVIDNLRATSLFQTDSGRWFVRFTNGDLNWAKEFFGL